MPRLAQILDRPRLFRILDKARSRKILWISGPAGSGKTTLVASYARKRNLRVHWYRIDSSDAVARKFRVLDIEATAAEVAIEGEIVRGLAREDHVVRRHRARGLDGTAAHGAPAAERQVLQPELAIAVHVEHPELRRRRVHLEHRARGGSAHDRHVRFHVRQRTLSLGRNGGRASGASGPSRPRAPALSDARAHRRPTARNAAYSLGFSPAPPCAGERPPAPARSQRGLSLPAFPAKYPPRMEDSTSGGAVSFFRAPETARGN